VADLVFRDAVLLLPAAVALHVPGPAALAGALAIAVVFQTLEVGHNVFERW
jgi:hypothetical protein